MTTKKKNQLTTETFELDNNIRFREVDPTWVIEGQYIKIKRKIKASIKSVSQALDKLQEDISAVTKKMNQEFSAIAEDLTETHAPLRKLIQAYENCAGVDMKGRVDCTVSPVMCEEVLELKASVSSHDIGRENSFCLELSNVKIPPKSEILNLYKQRLELEDQQKGIKEDAETLDTLYAEWLDDGKEGLIGSLVSGCFNEETQAAISSSSDAIFNQSVGSSAEVLKRWSPKAALK